MLKNRFLSVFALSFAAGIATPFLAENGWEAVIFIGFLLLAALFAGVYTASYFRAPELKKYLLYPVIVAVGLSLGCGWLCLRALPYEDYASYVGISDTVKGTVTETGSSSESKYIEIRVEKSRVSLPTGTKIRLYGEKYETISIGDYVTAEISYSALSGNGARATSVCLVANGYVSEKNKGDGFLASLRYTLGENCIALYEKYNAEGVAQALTLRERSLLSPVTNEAYRNAGLSHLLAISGLHLSVLVATLRRLLFWFRLRKQTRELISLGVILLYCILTGFSPSIVRAAVMVGAVLLGDILLRETDGITLLAIALLVLLAANPYALLSVSLQLSFLSCLGIILLEPSVTALQGRIRGNEKGKHPLIRRGLSGAAGLFLTSSSAVVFTFPVIAYTFGTLSWLSPLTNLVFVPLFTPVLTLLLLSVLVYSVIPFLGVGLAFLPGGILMLMEKLFRFLSDREIGSMTLSPQWVMLPIVLSCVAIACVLLFKKKGVSLFLCFAAGSVLSLSVCAAAEAFSSPERYAILSAEEKYLYVALDGKGTYLDLGGDALDSKVPEGHTIEEYIVTTANDEALMRFCDAIKTHTVSKVYLPAVNATGGKNDLALFLEASEIEGCETVLYMGIAETELLHYDLRGGNAVTPFGITVLLEGGESSLSDSCVWVMPAFRGDLSDITADELYVPFETDPKMYPSDTDLHFYRLIVIYQNGEVSVP